MSITRDNKNEKKGCITNPTETLGGDARVVMERFAIKEQRIKNRNIVQYSPSRRARLQETPRRLRNFSNLNRASGLVKVSAIMSSVGQ